MKKRKVIAGVAVDTAVPIPEHRVQYNARWYDLAKDMDIGDSVVLNFFRTPDVSQCSN